MGGGNGRISSETKGIQKIQPHQITLAFDLTVLEV